MQFSAQDTFLEYPSSGRSKSNDWKVKKFNSVSEQY
jgi:hypothetical protein